MSEEIPGTLKIGEYHPAANSAMDYIKKRIFIDIGLLCESLASYALSGDRNAEVCLETLLRVRENLPVSDRYLLGLAWTLKELEELI